MTDDEFKSLYRHHKATVGLFIALWLFVLVAILLVEFFSLSETARDSLMGAALGGVIVLCLLQFKKRCPDCEANLGRQRRLGIPRRCMKCGALLRTAQKTNGD